MANAPDQPTAKDKAWNDVRMFGTGVYIMSPNGVSEHIPLENIRKSSDTEVDELAQIIRQAHVLTQIGRNTGFTMTPWETLCTREQAPYIASAVAAFRHFKESVYPNRKATHET